MLPRITMYALILFLAACNDTGSSITEMLTGQEAKTWIKRSTEAAGSVGHLQREDQRETFTFYRSGKFEMTNGRDVMSGQWTLDGDSLRLHFIESDNSEIFTVLELKKSRMKLRTADGTELKLKAR
jgi:heat shock protein HslJ